MPHVWVINSIVNCFNDLRSVASLYRIVNKQQVSEKLAAVYKIFKIARMPRISRASKAEKYDDLCASSRP